MFLSKRNGVYYIYYNDSNAKRRSISTKSNQKADAIKFLTRFRDELRQREENPIIPVQLQDFINIYLRHSASFHSYATGKDFLAELNMLKNEVGNLMLTELTPKLMLEYIRKRGQKSIYVHAKCIRYFKAIFNWAVLQQYLLTNPVKNMKPVKIPEKQPAFFNESDIEKLLGAIDNRDIKDIAIFALNTGFRRAEIINLRWSQVDLQNAFVILDNNHTTTKSKKVRSMPLNQKALQVLTDRKILNEDFVFTYEGKEIEPRFLSKKFKKYVIKAKLNPKLKLHSTRHAFASLLVQKGISLYQVSKLLGHSSISVTEIYSHLSPENFRSAVDILN